MRPADRQSAARSVLIAALAFGGAAAAASDIEVRVKGCKAGVDLVARNAPLSAVLERLSEALRFRLHLQERPDARVDVALSAPAPELLKQLLSGHGRYIVTTTRDPRCRGQQRVARVWLLPEGGGARPSSSLAVSQPRPATAPAVKPAVRPPGPVTEIGTPQQLRAAEERSRRLKEAYDAHVARHGRPPEGEEQEEARP